MTEGKARTVCGQDDTHPTYYSPATLPLIQSLLATLANVEFEFEQECEKAHGIEDALLKTRVLVRLKAQHQTRRDPYVRQLFILQKQAFGTALEAGAA